MKRAGLFIVGLLAAGCASGGRYTIHQVENAYVDPADRSNNFVSREAVLLDTRTGRTWLLTGGEDEAERYYWQEISRRSGPWLRPPAHGPVMATAAEGRK